MNEGQQKYYNTEAFSSLQSRAQKIPQQTYQPQECLANVDMLSQNVGYQQQQFPLQQQSYNQPQQYPLQQQSYNQPQQYVLQQQSYNQLQQYPLQQQSYNQSQQSYGPSYQPQPQPQKYGYSVEEVDNLRGKGNEERQEYDLGKDGAFNDFSVLVGCFYHEVATAWPKNAGAVLSKKGFRVDMTSNEHEFIQMLKKKEHDVAWIVSGSSSNCNAQDFKNEVVSFHESGRGLFIFGDNEPYYVHANLVLPSIVGTKLVSMTPSNRVLSYGEPNKPGEFDQNSLIFAGINYLYEGHTICYPETDGKLTHLATSTDNKPAISFMESTEKHGRVIVDNGFTKLYMSWTSAGQARYVVNACVYLVDVERRFG